MVDASNYAGSAGSSGKGGMSGPSAEPGTNSGARAAWPAGDSTATSAKITNRTVSTDMAHRAAAPISDPRARKARLIQEGRNVWKSARADHVAFLIDGEQYFAQLEAALSRAKRSVWIIGWDFDAQMLLRPQAKGEQPTLGAFLRSLVDQSDQLEIRILVWGVGQWYSGGISRLLRNSRWSEHPRIFLHYDSAHPVRASHHQKIVCIDDSIAFVGGIDLTSKRWDQRSHLAECDLRTTPDGKPYGPVHDVQVMVSGSAAHLAAEVARRRWERGTGAAAPAIDCAGLPWPDGLKPEMENCAISFALSEPGIGGHKRYSQTIKLACDAIDAARDHIYIEAQYLASPKLTAHLSERLRQAHGPEVVIVVTRRTKGILEQLTMGYGRQRAIRRLERANRHGRLRIGYPVVPAQDGSDCEILVHSKVIIVDDKFVRVGSSNFNRRSEGFDTECDLAIEAQDEPCRRAIEQFRNDLLAEHVAAEVVDVRDIVQQTGSLIAALDRLNVKPRGLRPFFVSLEKHWSPWIVARGIFDPMRPYWPLQRLRAPVLTAAGRLGALLRGRF